MAGRVRIVWSLARIALLTVGVLAGAGSGCGYSARAMPGQRVDRTAAAGGSPISHATKLNVRVYNYARVNPATLASAERLAGAIFAETGVKTGWVDCPLSKRQFGSHPTCQTSATPADIDLKILPRRMAEKLHVRNEPLGFALPCADDDPACEATIFYYVVDELATDGYREDAILGHAIAHEMAHVLIGGAHSETGIMRAEWSRPELQKMSWGILLGFNDAQSEELRAAAMRRGMAQERFASEASFALVDLGRGAK